MTYMMPPIEIQQRYEAIGKYEKVSVTPIFTTRARPRYSTRSTGFYTHVGLADHWHRTLKRAGIVSRKQYQTRHTYACWLLTATGNPAFIAEQMGHSDMSMVMRVYGAWMPGSSKREVERVWNALEKITPQVQGYEKVPREYPTKKPTTVIH
ncbi:MAG: hypothetical protein B0D91_14935 [Oceanospirillales bacterium LUC14_002_19_P2]|nr:MAG: hypothetical protein B0D91_14935 [Oceanospirillales bacterium LUC14_002_19_P2]